MLYTNGNHRLITNVSRPPIVNSVPNIPVSIPLRPNRQGHVRFYNEPSTQQPNPPLIPYKDQMKWGEPTWTLFHVLVEKVKPEHFAAIRPDLIDVITSICANLQCPDCSHHATTYLASVNFNNIQTKDQLRIMLYTFHNTVNERKSVQLFEFEQMDVYKQMNTATIIHRFMYFFEIKYTTNLRMMPNGFARTQQAHKLKQWFDRNIMAFDM